MQAFWKTLLLAALVIVGNDAMVRDAAANNAQEDPRLRVMSFNIRYANPGDGKHVWVNRKEMVASVVRFHRADLVGMQEALKTQIEDLEELLPGYAWLGVGRNDGKENGEYVPIFYRADRFEVLDKGTFWLSETPEEPGSMSWDTSLPRITTWARFKDKSSGRTFVHMNTHFDHRGNEARRESAKLMIRRAEELAKDSPVVVTGDFNCLREHSPYQIMVGQGEDSGTTQESSEATSLLVDAHFASEEPHHGGDSTINAFTEPKAGFTIDYIFTTSNFKVHRHGIITDTWGGLFPSDHMPVLAEITLPHAE